MKAAIYARVSTEDQTTDNQVSVLLQMAENRGWDVYHIYQENESGWKQGRQGELKKLIAAAIEKKFEIVLVWSLDRLTRGGVLPILEMVHSFKRYGVKVISFQESFTEAPSDMDDILYALIGWIANFESRLRSERTKAGLDRAAKEGRRPGRRPGSKDKKPRKKTGYLERGIRQRKARDILASK